MRSLLWSRSLHQTKSCFQSFSPPVIYQYAKNANAQVTAAGNDSFPRREDSISSGRLARASSSTSLRMRCQPPSSDCFAAKSSFTYQSWLYMHCSDTAGSTPKRSRSALSVMGEPKFVRGVKMRMCVPVFFRSASSLNGIVGASNESNENGDASARSSSGPMNRPENNARASSFVIRVLSYMRCLLHTKRHLLSSGTHQFYQIPAGAVPCAHPTVAVRPTEAALLHSQAKD